MVVAVSELELLVVALVAVAATVVAVGHVAVGGVVAVVVEVVCIEVLWAHIHLVVYLMVLACILGWWLIVV